MTSKWHPYGNRYTLACNQSNILIEEQKSFSCFDVGHHLSYGYIVSQRFIVILSARLFSLKFLWQEYEHRSRFYNANFWWDIFLCCHSGLAILRYLPWLWLVNLRGLFFMGSTRRDHKFTVVCMPSVHRSLSAQHELIHPLKN